MQTPLSDGEFEAAKALAREKSDEVKALYERFGDRVEVYAQFSQYTPDGETRVHRVVHLLYRVDKRDLSAPRPMVDLTTRQVTIPKPEARGGREGRGQRPRRKPSSVVQLRPILCIGMLRTRSRAWESVPTLASPSASSVSSGEGTGASDASDACVGTSRKTAKPPRQIQAVGVDQHRLSCTSQDDTSGSAHRA